MILPVETDTARYDIVLESGCLAQAGKQLNLDRRVLIVTDDGVPEQYAAAVAAQCACPTVCRVPQGEGSKSIATLESLLVTMLRAGFTRHDCVAAVGGGVVGDLAGFTASTYMRGVDFYNIPTTVLSQVDSSVGGKTAVNLDGIKNAVGAFHQPKKVLIDPDTLSTLPRRQIANGLAESVKMALTSDKELFSLFERGEEQQQLETVLYRSLDIKRRVVEQDEKETGLRKILNFGHTVGHGIESQHSGLYHGECVALGMIPLCSAPVRERLIPVLERLGLPTRCDLNADSVYRALLHDKKSTGNGITVIRVEEVGQWRMETVAPTALRELLPLVIKGG